MKTRRKTIAVLGTLVLVGVVCVAMASIALARADSGAAAASAGYVDLARGSQVAWGSDAVGARRVDPSIATTVTAVSPTVKAVGSSAFTMTVTGQNLNAGATLALFSGKVTPYTASVPAALLTTPGSGHVKVFNPGSTRSTDCTSTAAATIFTVTQPTLTGVSPTSAVYAGSPVELTLTGTHLKDGLAGPTLVLKGTGLISSTTIATSGAVTQTSNTSMKGTFSLTAPTAAPAGDYDVVLTYGATGSVTLHDAFTVGPTLTSITPKTGPNSNAALAFALVGQRLNGLTTPSLSLKQGLTTVRTATSLTLLPGSTTKMTGTFNLATPTPVPAGVYDVVLDFGTAGSARLTGGFTVTNPVPTVTTISPTTVYAGSAQPLVLTVNGTGFVPAPAGAGGSAIKIGTRTTTNTTFVSATQLTVPLTAVDIAAAAAVPITVVNPAPGGGTSNAVNLTVAADTTAPVTTIAGADSAWHNTPVVLTVTATDAQSGVMKTEYDINGASPIALVETTVTVPADGTSEGENVVDAWSTDWCGNVENPGAEVTMKIDTVKPKAYGKAATGTHGKNITLKYKITDNVSPKVQSIYVKITTTNGKVVKNQKISGQKTPDKWYSFTWKAGSKGTYNYYVHGEDLAGNTSTTSPAKITVK